MDTYNDPALEQYAALDRMGEERSRTFKQMIAKVSPQFIMAHGGEMLQHFKDLKALSIQSQYKLEELSRRYDHDSDKFSQMLQGAERRLDRQLEDMSMMRRALLSLPVSDMSPEAMRHQSFLLQALSDAQDSFNRELDRLYDL
ncbi:MAG: hypothetical protein K2G69_01355 [Muribaculaceae bacterium]|nr:hypothetical protein [Muribaculaceae bacterium]